MTVEPSSLAQTSVIVQHNALKSPVPEGPNNLLYIPTWLKKSKDSRQNFERLSSP